MDGARSIQVLHRDSGHTVERRHTLECFLHLLDSSDTVQGGRLYKHSLCKTDDCHFEKSQKKCHKSQKHINQRTAFLVLSFSLSWSPGSLSDRESVFGNNSAPLCVLRRANPRSFHLLSELRDGRHGAAHLELPDLSASASEKGGCVSLLQSAAATE